MTLVERIRANDPELVTDVVMYPTSEGGKRCNASSGWHCLCMLSNMPPWEGHSGWPLLGATLLEPGAAWRLGFVFQDGDPAAEVFRKAGHFFLWDGRVVGEAFVVA